MRLIIPADVEAKLNAYVMSVETEIAGMGKAKVSDGGDVFLLDVAIYDQTVTHGTADLSSEALARFQTDLIRAGESPKDWVVWWHSHASMGAFFSSTDTGTIEGSTEFQYLVSLVVNRKRERKARLDLYHPFRFTENSLEIIVGRKEETIPQAIRDEVQEKVKVKSWLGYNKSDTNTLGFGKHSLIDLSDIGSGKKYPASSVDDYDDSLSGVNTAGDVIEKIAPTYASRSEVMVVIDALKEEIRTQTRISRDTENDDVLDDLKAQLGEWEWELSQRDDVDKLGESYKNFNEGK